MQRLIEKYPDGQLEEYTIKFLNDSLSGGITTYFFLSYDKALILMKAEEFMFSRNFSEALKYATEFINTVDEKDHNIRQDLYSVYTISFVSLKRLGMLGEAEQIKKKMLTLFPEKAHLIKE